MCTEMSVRMVVTHLLIVFWDGGVWWMAYIYIYIWHIHLLIYTYFMIKICSRFVYECMAIWRLRITFYRARLSSFMEPLKLQDILINSLIIVGSSGNDGLSRKRCAIENRYIIMPSMPFIIDKDKIMPEITEAGLNYVTYSLRIENTTNPIIYVRFW